jgi:nucleoside-diphosphate-sugar epimerase
VRILVIGAAGMIGRKLAGGSPPTARWAARDRGARPRGRGRAAGARGLPGRIRAEAADLSAPGRAARLVEGGRT